MKHRGFSVIALWGLFLAILIAVGLIAFDITDPAPPAMLGGSAALMIVVAIGLAVSRRDVPDTGAHTTPDTSPPTVWTALSLFLLVLSAELGFWLSLIAGGMIAVGLAGVARELRAQRQATRAYGAGEPR